MNTEYKKAAEKLLCGITDSRLREPAIWNDILSSVRSGKLRLWEINDEILRIKYFCKEKIERASAFTESDKSGVRFDDLNAYFVEAIKNGDKGYFGAFIRTYEPVLQSRAERFVSRYDLSADDAEDIKQIFLETLWFAFLDYDAADPIPLLQYVKKRRCSDSWIISAQRKTPAPCRRKTGTPSCERSCAFITALPSFPPMRALRLQ